MNRLHHNHPLKGHNSFGVDARAAAFMEIDDWDGFARFAATDLSRYREVRVLGLGCNTLITKDIDGIVLHPANRDVELLRRDGDTVTLRVGAGAEWDAVVERCLANGWHGLENLSLIPSSAGAAVVQNIGAYGSEAGQRVAAVEVFDYAAGRRARVEGRDCGFGYRRSVFKEPAWATAVITHVELRLSARPAVDLSYAALAEALSGVPAPTPSDVRRAVVAVRRSKLPDPAELGNAGSFFKNPVVPAAAADALQALHPAMPRWEAGPGQAKLSAAWLIDLAGLRGHTAPNGAGVYERQPLVLVNRGGATGRQIWELAGEVARRVRQATGVDLEPEVVLW